MTKYSKLLISTQESNATVKCDITGAADFSVILPDTMISNVHETISVTGSSRFLLHLYLDVQSMLASYISQTHS